MTTIVPTPTPNIIYGSLSGNDTKSVTAGGVGTIRFTVEGEWSGVIRFEGSLNGVKWAPISALPYPQSDPTRSLASVESTDHNDNWVASGAGLVAFRLRCEDVTGTAEVVMLTAAEAFIVAAVPIVDGTLDTHNSRLTPLGKDEVFTGKATDILPYTSIRLTIATDVASAVDGFVPQFSIDGVHWDHKFPVSITDANLQSFVTLGRVARYFRIVYKNGPKKQSFFRLHVILQRGVIQEVQSKLLSSSIVNSDTALITKSVIQGQTDKGDFISVGATDDKRLRVSAIINQSKKLKSKSFTLIKTGTIVPGVKDKRIRVYSYVKSFTNTINSNFRSGAKDALEGYIKGQSGSTVTESVTPPAFLFETGIGESLDLTVSASGVNGRVSYWEE